MDLDNPRQRADIFGILIRYLDQFADVHAILANEFRVLATCRDEQFYALCERFVPINQSFQSFVNRHRRYLLV